MIFGTLSPQDFNEQMNDTDVIVIDVRTPNEHQEFWVLPKVDLYMDMHDRDFFEKLWKLERNKKYLIYCWHANRTETILNYMRNIGFEYVQHLQWWIDEWVKSGLKVEVKK